MATKFWLTDEDSLIEGYKRAKLGSKSDSCSLVRAETATLLGPQVIPITRLVGGGVVKWITDPLDGPSISGSPWSLRIWARQSAVAANVGLRLQIFQFTTTETTNLVTVDSPELSTTFTDVALTTDPPSTTSLDIGDRLVFKISLIDSGGVMATGYTATVSYNGLYPRGEGDSYFQSPDNIDLPEDLPDVDVLSIRSILYDMGGSNPQLEDQEIKRHIQEAIQTYSVDSPRRVSAYISGNGTSFDFPLPGQWIWGYSRISEIEFPANQQFPATQDTVNWEVRESLLGTQPTRFIRFKLNVPEAGLNNVQVYYTTRHDYSKEFSTIPPEHYQAVLWLAGAFCAISLSSRGAGSSDSTISVDVVNHRDAEVKWGNIAERLRKMYLDRVVHPPSSTPVGSTEAWNPTLQTGQQFLWHNRRHTRRVPTA